MKISYLVPMTWACGGILAPFSQVNALVAKGHDVTVYAPKGGTVDWFPLAAPLKPFPEFSAGMQDAVVFVGDTFTAADLVFARHKFLLLQGKDHVWTTAAKRRELLKGYANPQFHILAVSTWLAEFVREKCDNPRVTVIGNGVDTTRFCPAREPRDGFRLLIEGNFPDKNKNVIEALEAASRIRQIKPVEIWAMGRRFVSTGSLVDRVLLDPPANQVAGAYQQCDALLKTSIMEGFGLPHLEAMACGCIPVTYASGGISDFCRHGENSLVTGVGNIPALVWNTIRLTSDTDLRRQLQTGALATARSMTWDRVAERLEQALALEIEGR
jgi:glycosyltransferase involved in cell wall biosynthesis